MSMSPAAVPGFSGYLAPQAGSGAVAAPAALPKQGMEAPRGPAVSGGVAGESGSSQSLQLI